MITDRTFSKMPSVWQDDASVHKQLRALPVGTAIAALKLYLAMCVKATFPESDEADGKVCCSLAQWVEYTTLSRPMVIRGFRALVDLGLVLRIGARPVIYEIDGYQSHPRWAKLPTKVLLGSHFRTNDLVEGLRAVSNRGQPSFEALQLYLYLATIRDRNTDQAKVTYDKISEKLLMGRNAISRAISTLVGANLIGVRTDSTPAGSYGSNVYWLSGTPGALRRDEPMTRSVQTPVAPRQVPAA